MIDQDQIQNVIGATAYDRSLNKIGKVGQVYYDDETNRPKWITVNTGLFGINESFVPLEGARFEGGDLILAYDKAQVKDAPNIPEGAHLSRAEEDDLYRHYGIADGGAASGRQALHPTGTATDTAGTSTAGTYTAGTETAGRDAPGTRGQDTSGPTTDDAMTRSEERLNVGTETREAGRARLRKHVVTEEQRVNVPVSREEVTVEREPITDANRAAAYDGPTISEEEHEVTLREERPVVETEAVPVERVRLGTETVTEQETVGGEVRKEEIEVDDDANHRDAPADRS